MHSRNNSLTVFSEILTLLKDYCYYPVYQFTDIKHRLAADVNSPVASKLPSAYTPRSIEMFAVA